MKYLRHAFAALAVTGFLLVSTAGQPEIQAQDVGLARPAMSEENDPVTLGDPSTQLPEQLRPSNFDAKDITAANSMVSSLNVADWLGPLAPVALSPFFGLACLSGLSIWGPEWIANNALLSAAGPLKSEIVFGVFLLLTGLTSLPRMSKVSKPFAQAMDQLETYSVIVILLVIKFFASTGEASPEAEVAVVQLGVFSFTADTLLAIAMVINLFVVNSVKFFFEILVWLTPIPAIDALFEICNKSVCAGLMALYAFSPTIATIVNLIVLLVSLFVFRWAYRRMTFYRGIFVDLILSRIWKSYGVPGGRSFLAYPKESIDPFCAKSKCSLSVSEGVLQISELGWLGSKKESIPVEGTPRLKQGWIMHSLDVKAKDGAAMTFHVSRRYDAHLTTWANQTGVSVAEPLKEVLRDPKVAGAEFV